MSREPVDESELSGGLFGSDEDFHRAWREWEGMPDYERTEIRPFGSVMVHFASDEDRRAFERLIGQEITLPSLRGIWYPKLDITRFIDKRYRDAAVPAGDDVPGETYLGGTRFNEPGSRSITLSTGSLGQKAREREASS